MDKVLEFELSGLALKQYEETMKGLLNDWLIVKNNKDVLISFFIFEEVGTVNIDCVYLQEEGMMETLELTKKLFEKLKIEYNFLSEEFM